MISQKELERALKLSLKHSATVESIMRIEDASPGIALVEVRGLLKLTPRSQLIACHALGVKRPAQKVRVTFVLEAYDVTSTP